MNRKVVTRTLLWMGLALALGGCTYDYLQRTDRVAYHAGDAVRANLERETTDPSKRSMKSVRGLGKNGVVIPGETTTEAAGDAPATEAAP